MYRPLLRYPNSQGNQFDIGSVSLSSAFVKSIDTVWSINLQDTIRMSRSGKRVLVADYKGTAYIAKFYPKDNMEGLALLVRTISRC